MQLLWFLVFFQVIQLLLISKTKLVINASIINSFCFHILNKDIDIIDCTHQVAFDYIVGFPLISYMHTIFYFAVNSKKWTIKIL